MKRSVHFLAVIAFLVLVAAPTMASATDLPRILIMGEDVDRDTIPRKSRVFKRVQNALSNSLINEGFDVKDETALTLDTHVQDRQRRDDGELIQIAKDVGMDILVIFSIYPNVKSNQNSVKVWSRVEGRILSVQDGSRLGNFEAEPQKYQLVPKPYERNDILEAVGKMASIIGTEVGDVLTSRLSGYHSGGEGDIAKEWKLVFDGFSDDDMFEIDEYIVIFSGYKSHRPDPAAMNTSKHHVYLYKSSIDSAKMKRNLHKMFEKLNMEARTGISGLEVEMKKVPGVKQRTKKKDSEW